ncbi:hypothetical protein HNY73_001549 [Argiope bruennichi]|uniref:Uncharacterized protein n=1 Tax=Argiope bruennichi TaxID=94029 RepID=A0A8T0G1Q6_ARGBR|nr:hypothetical protein HNY73_001549 [Argiope bruennichi]
MRSGQKRMEQMTAGLEKKLESGQGEMKKEIREHVEMQVEGMKEHVNECIGKIEEDVQSVKKEIEDIKEEVDNAQGKINFLEKSLCDLEERPITFLPRSEVMYSRPTVKPLTFDGQTSWSAFKTQFDVGSSSNGWTDRVKASHLVASLQWNQIDWDMHLPLFLLAYRSAVHEATGWTPSEMLFDRTLRLPCDSRIGPEHWRTLYVTSHPVFKV